MGSSSDIFLSSGGFNASEVPCFFLGFVGVWGKFWPVGYRLCAGASWGRGGSAWRDEDASRGSGFDRPVSEAADRDCATDSGKDGTGGGGTGGASALFDKAGRVEPKVMERDLRSDCDSLRMRDPEEPGDATDGLRGGGDESVWGASVGFNGGDEGNGCSAGRCEES